MFYMSQAYFWHKVLYLCCVCQISTHFSSHGFRREFMIKIKGYGHESKNLGPFLTYSSVCLRVSHHFVGVEQIFRATRTLWSSAPLVLVPVPPNANVIHKPSCQSQHPPPCSQYLMLVTNPNVTHGKKTISVTHGQNMLHRHTKTMQPFIQGLQDTQVS